MINKQFLNKAILNNNQDIIGEIYGFNYRSIQEKELLIETFKEASKIENPLIFLQNKLK